MVGLFRASTAVSNCHRAVSLGMRFDDNRESTFKFKNTVVTSLLHLSKKRCNLCMMRAAAEHTTPDGNARKALGVHIYRGSYSEPKGNSS